MQCEHNVHKIEWSERKGVPLNVSPLLSSTSMGEPWAAVSSDNGSCGLAGQFKWVDLVTI